QLDRSLRLVQGLDWPVRGLLADRIVKMRCRVVGVQLLGHGVLALVEPRALLLVIRLAEITADDGVVGVEARRCLDLATSAVQVALPDSGQPQPEPGQGIGRAARERLLS